MTRFPVHKTIQGMDFEFDLMQKGGQSFYLVKADDIKFEMHSSGKDKWKIHGAVKPWIREIETELSDMIQSLNKGG